MYRILVIDDEQAIRSMLMDIITMFIPEAVIAGEAESVASGLKAIRETRPDIVLLDIRMADGTGFDLLNRLDYISFKVIFITAYEEYAIRAFKYSAIDYILKPFDPEELISAVQKAINLAQQEMVQRLEVLKENLSSDHHHKKIIIRTAENIYLVKIEDLVCLESDQAYTKIYLADTKTIFVSRSLREFEDLLEPSGFFRVHKSFLINLEKISHVEKSDGGLIVMHGENAISS